MMPDNPLTLVSIHDVMPATLDRVEQQATILERAGLAPVTLLVVPGLDWSRSQLLRLRALSDNGYELAGHGWVHRIEDYRNLAHRIHGLLLSRRVAEHLEQDGEGIERLMCRCRTWFEEQNLPAPALYVPPAWAMGNIAKSRLHDTGYRYFEYLDGIFDATTNRFHRIPLLGYEADTPLRATLLKISNAVNLFLAQSRGIIRLSIHPLDLELLLSSGLRELIQSGIRCASLQDLVTTDT